MDENLIVELENEGIVSGTFRKLSPNKKGKVYHAALNAFGAGVYDRVSLDDIAVTAEISKGSLIQYFVCKENLYSFIAEIVLSNYLYFWDNYWAEVSVPRFKDRLEKMFWGVDKFRAEYTGEMNFILKNLYETGFSLSADFCRRLINLEKEYLSALVEHGKQTQQIRRDIKVDRTVFFIHQIYAGIIRENYYLNVFEGEGGNADLVENCINLILNGIKY